MRKWAAVPSQITPQDLPGWDAVTRVQAYIGDDAKRQLSTIFHLFHQIVATPEVQLYEDRMNALIGNIQALESSLVGQEDVLSALGPWLQAVQEMAVKATPTEEDVEEAGGVLYSGTDVSTQVDLRKLKKIRDQSNTKDKAIIDAVVVNHRETMINGYDEEYYDAAQAAIGSIENPTKKRHLLVILATLLREIGDQKKFDEEIQQQPMAVSEEQYARQSEERKARRKQKQLEVDPEAVLARKVKVMELLAQRVFDVEYSYQKKLDDWLEIQEQRLNAKERGMVPPPDVSKPELPVDEDVIDQVIKGVEEKDEKVLRSALMKSEWLRNEYNKLMKMRSNDLQTLYDKSMLIKPSLDTLKQRRLILDRERKRPYYQNLPEKEKSEMLNLRRERRREFFETAVTNLLQGRWSEKTVEHREGIENPIDEAWKKEQFEKALKVAEKIKNFDWSQLIGADRQAWKRYLRNKNYKKLLELYERVKPQSGQKPKTETKEPSPFKSKRQGPRYYPRGQSAAPGAQKKRQQRSNAFDRIMQLTKLATGAMDEIGNELVLIYGDTPDELKGRLADISHLWARRKMGSNLDMEIKRAIRQMVFEGNLDQPSQLSAYADAEEKLRMIRLLQTINRELNEEG